jgi:hypothetical protein
VNAKFGFNRKYAACETAPADAQRWMALVPTPAAVELCRYEAPATMVAPQVPNDTP